MAAFRLFGLGAFLAILPFKEAFAQVPDKKAPRARFLVGGALELGGDRVAEVYFINGNSQSIKAGQGISIALGGEFQVPKLEKLLLRATVGYKYVTTAADNAHIRLTRVPILLTVNWLVTERFRVGGGLALHRGIQLKADGIGPDLTFYGAMGPTVDFAYRGVGLQYTVMQYTDQKQNTYSANAIGLSFTATIPHH